MKILEVRDCKNVVGWWQEYYFFGKKIYTRLVCLYRYK